MRVEIKLTDACNLTCSYCYYKNQKIVSEMNDAALHMTLDFFLERAFRTGQKVLDITFFGGEPLLHADQIIRCVDGYSNKHCEKIRLRHTICTNGTLLTNDLIQEFVNRKIGIILSLDGQKEIHDLNRHDTIGSGSWERISPFFSQLAVLGVPIEKVIAINTIKKTSEAMQWLFNAGFTRIIAIPDFLAAWNPDNLDDLQEEYLKIAMDYIKRKKSGQKIHFSPFEDKIDLHLSDQSYRQHSCNFVCGSFVVTADSGIYPCTRFAADFGDDRYKLGDIQNGVDENKLAQIIKTVSLDKPACAICTIRNRCLGNCCSCLAYSLGRDISFLSPLVCEHERMITKIADFVAKELYA